MHQHPNNANNHHHAFVCDNCKRIAGINRDESAALSEARQTAQRDGWKWTHPGWALTCPDCKKDGKQ